MEIEAKFVLPDRATFRRLQQIGQLAGFSLSPARTERIHDTYLDTSGGSMQRAGYVCRRRERNGKILMTVKRLPSVSETIHRREESEITLSKDLPPAKWPESPARDRVLEIIGQAALEPLFDLTQKRTVRTIMDADRPIAELSLDRVRAVAGNRRDEFCQVECELMPQGREDELARIARCLHEEFKLEPEPGTKFDRALEFFRAAPPSDTPRAMPGPPV